MIKYEKTRLETEMEIVEKVEWEKYLVFEKIYELLYIIQSKLFYKAT